MSETITDQDQQSTTNVTSENASKKDYFTVKFFGSLAAIGIGIGSYIGWRDARADQGRLDAAATELASYRKQAAITQDMIARTEASVPEACRTELQKYVTGENRDDSDLDAVTALVDVEACPKNIAKIVLTDRRDQADLSFNQGQAQYLELDMPNLISDAKSNIEVPIYAAAGGLVLPGAIALRIFI